MYQGYNLKKNGYRILVEEHFQKKLISNKKNAMTTIEESIKGEKGVEEHLPFAHDSVETENNNKEIPEYQLVTGSGN
jgi:hypothetical protein